ncbi:MAG: TlpA family protein disulfide reductase [Chromatiales bacterium]|nr:TlpA family protein disulfide reductase [Chromatiales bacterium]
MFLLATSSLPAKAEINPLLLSEYPDLDGKSQLLSQWQGKFLFINFWASWCLPCLREIPEFAGFQKEKGGEGVQVIGVALDDPRRLATTVRTLGINYPVLIVPPSKTREILSEWGDLRAVLPFTAVFNAEGRMILRHTGPLDRDALDAYLDEVRNR